MFKNKGNKGNGGLKHVNMASNEFGYQVAERIRFWNEQHGMIIE
jgi:hypothetical protein